MTELEFTTLHLTGVMPDSIIIGHKKDNQDLLIKVEDKHGRHWWFRKTDSGIKLEGQDK